MYDYCVMPWQIFLKLFKKDYNLFIYYNNKWHFKHPHKDIPINLNYSPDNKFYFCNVLFSSVTFVTEEEINGFLQTRIQ